MRPSQSRPTDLTHPPAHPPTYSTPFSSLLQLHLQLQNFTWFSTQYPASPFLDRQPASRYAAAEHHPEIELEASVHGSEFRNRPIHSSASDDPDPPAPRTLSKFPQPSTPAPCILGTNASRAPSWTVFNRSLRIGLNEPALNRTPDFGALRYLN